MSDQWFPPSQLAFYFDSNSWAKGTALYLKNEVLSAQMSPDGDDWRAEAQVLGSLQEPYRVTAHVRVSEGRNLQAWRTQCTCPAGRMCKHAAALGILVAMQGETLRDALLSDNDEGVDTEQQQQVRQERALQQAEFQVRDWLNRLQMADAPTGFVLPGQAHEHFLYCLSAATLGHRPIFHLTIKQAVAKPNGEWAKVKKVVSQALPNDPIWRSCAPGEQGIFDLMKACPPTNSFSSYGFQSSVKLQGAAAEVLLRLCSQTGRLMWEDGKTLKPLVWSDMALPFNVSWQSVAAQGHAPEGWQLQLTTPQPGVLHGLNEPPLYVHPAQGVCGRMDTQGLSAEHLLLLSQAPVVPERVALKLQQPLMDVMGHLPLPPVIDQLPELRGVTPVGVLQLRVTPAHLRSEQGLFQVELKFQYQDITAYWSQPHARVVVGQAPQQRMLLRDLHAEQSLWESLDDLGLVIWDDNLLGMPGSDGQERWLDWLESDFAELRQAGFEVTGQDGLAHWLRLAEDVQVRLQGQHTESGTDDTSPWFDLSLGMSIDGERVNILP
ncbi:MAG: polymerase-associated protein RapA, partial [Pseudomonadota bacterium]